MSKIIDQENKIIIEMDDIYIEPDDMIIGAMLYFNEEGRNTEFLGFDKGNRAVVSVNGIPYTIAGKGTSGRGVEMVQVFHLTKTDEPVNPEKNPKRADFISKKYAIHYEKRFGKPIN